MSDMKVQLYELFCTNQQKIEQYPMYRGLKRGNNYFL